MRYDRGDSFPFGSKMKGKPSPRSYSIERERKWKYSFLDNGKLLENSSPEKIDVEGTSIAQQTEVERRC